MTGVSIVPLRAQYTSQLLQDRRSVVNAPVVTGKMFVIFTFQQFLKAEERNRVQVASSAVTAQLPNAGRAAYSGFQIPILIEQDSVCNISTDQSVADDLIQTGLIIWHEFIMSHRHNLKAVEGMIHHITRPELDCGEKAAILIGDFRQVLLAVHQGY